MAAMSATNKNDVRCPGVVAGCRDDRVRHAASLERFACNIEFPGPWRFGMSGFGEMLPDERNRVWLDSKRKDRWGIPLLHIDCKLRDNEMAMLEAMASDGKETLEAAGLTDVDAVNGLAPPGLMIHEMGTARMGNDPANSVLNKHCQAHDVPNLFVTDGACMTSSACQNPSLTYMAITARAAATAADMLKEGQI